MIKEFTKSEIQNLIDKAINNEPNQEGKDYLKNIIPKLYPVY